MITMSTRKKIRKAQPKAHRPPLHLPRCPVEGKLCFPDEDAAAVELFECRIQFLFRNKARRKEARSYLCDHCESFHLTAMIDPPKHVSEGSRDGVPMPPKKKITNPVRTPVRPATVRHSGGAGFESSVDWSAPVSDSGPSYCAPDSPPSDTSSSCGGGGGGE